MSDMTVLQSWETAEIIWRYRDGESIFHIANQMLLEYCKVKTLIEDTRLRCSSCKKVKPRKKVSLKTAAGRARRTLAPGGKEVERMSPHRPRRRAPVGILGLMIYGGTSKRKVNNVPKP